MKSHVHGSINARQIQKRLKALKMNMPTEEELKGLNDDTKELIKQNVTVNNTAIDNSVKILQPLADIEKI